MQGHMEGHMEGRRQLQGSPQGTGSIYRLRFQQAWTGQLTMGTLCWSP